MIIIRTRDLKPGMIARLLDHDLGRFLVSRVTSSNNLVYAVEGWLDDEELTMTEVRLYVLSSREWEVVTAVSDAL